MVDLDNLIHIKNLSFINMRALKKLLSPSSFKHEIPSPYPNKQMENEVDNVGHKAKGCTIIFFRKSNRVPNFDFDSFIDNLLSTIGPSSQLLFSCSLISFFFLFAFLFLFEELEIGLEIGLEIVVSTGFKLLELLMFEIW